MTTKLNPDLDPDTEASDTDAPDTHDESRTAAGSADPGPDIPDARVSRVVLPSFGLSATQLTGTALAAITATVAASYLGVTGTVVGAALASVLTAIGSAVYTTSLRTTRDRVREVVPLPARTRSLPAPVPVPDPTRQDGPPSLPGPRPGRRPRPHRATPSTPGPGVWKRAAVWAVGLFVVLMAVVTGVEVLAGRPVSDLVRGDSGGGTSFFGHDTVRTRTVPPVAPTVYVTVTPKVVVTTPTQTQTAPAATVTTTPSATTTVTPSATTTPTGNATPTAQPSSAASSTP